MAPTGRNNALTDDKKRQISDIPDLDLVSTSSRAEFNRSSSYNISLVCRAATSVAIATKENDDINALETTDIPVKVYPDVLEYGTLLDLYLPNTDIESLCGVDTEPINQSSITKGRTWRSTGKGKKRKKKKAAGSKKKIHKKHKTDDSMASVNESMKDSFTDVEHSFEFGGATAIINSTHGIAYKNCKKTAGDGKQNAGTKGGCVATQQTPSPPTGNSKVCCSHVRAHRGGGSGGDDGDDGEGKPPKKPPEVEPCSNAGKQKPKKKKKTSSEMDVDPVSSSAMDASRESTPEDTSDVEVVSDQQQEHTTHVQREQAQQQVSQKLLMTLNGCINHYNYCGKRPCVRCHRVEILIQHHFEETNGTCRCDKCKVWLCVLTYHTGICKLKGCIVCEKAKDIPCPTPAAPVIVNNQTPSLDPDDLIVWRNESFPHDITHFKEDKHYAFLDVIGEGGHGAVHNVEIPDDVKKKYFNSSCRDFVAKKTDKVEDDEKYVFEQTSNHPNLLETYLVLQKMHPKCHFRILMERCEFSLKDYLCKLAKDGKQLEMYEAMFYWTQTFDALKHLHHLRIPVIHKDVKAENVLLSIKDNLVRVKLADYDTVKRLHHEYTTPGLDPKGTPGLIAPEVLQQDSHGRPADVWNMGMFLLQMLFLRDFNQFQRNILALKTVKNMNKFLFINYTKQLINNFLNEKIPELQQMDRKLADLIQSCLNEDASKRPTAIEVLQHPAVTEYSRTGINMNELIRNLNA